MHHALMHKYIIPECIDHEQREVMRPQVTSGQTSFGALLSAFPSVFFSFYPYYLQAQAAVPGLAASWPQRSLNKSVWAFIICQGLISSNALWVVHRHSSRALRANE